MKILITGHRGYIGSKLYSKLNNETNIVHGIDLKEGKDLIHDLPSDTYDCVFHLAAFPSVQRSIEQPSNTFRNNAYATSVLLQWALEKKVKRLIFSSSAAAKDVSSPYGLQKLISEKECSLYSKLYGLETVSLRYFNVYSEDQKYSGAYSTVISAWMEMLRKGDKLTIDGDGEQVRDFIHVDDIVAANIFCMNYDESFSGAVFDIGSGKAFSINFIKNLIDNGDVEWAYAPPRTGDIKISKANINNILKLGWSPTVSFEEGIKRCFNRESV